MRPHTVFKFDSFSDFLDNELVKNSNFKRGEKKELAKFINIHPTSLSQVLKKTRAFTDEQVYLLGEFLNFNDIESQYIMLLHQIENATSKTFRAKLNKRKDHLKKKSLNLSTRIEKDKNLNDAEKSIFYSAWYYTCIWVFISIDKGKTRDEIHQRFPIGKKKIDEVLEFLVNAGLAAQENGKFHHKVNRTHLEKSSPFLKQHHSNWRIKAIEKKDFSDENDLSFTAPLSLSNKDFIFLREEIVALIKKTSDTVNSTTPEEIYCLNLDFFKI